MRENYSEKLTLREFKEINLLKLTPNSCSPASVKFLFLYFLKVTLFFKMFINKEFTI